MGEHTYGKIKSIRLNDEIVCSSRIIFVTLLTEKTEETIDIQLVRELHPEFKTEFDQLWKEVEKQGESGLVGRKVTLDCYGRYPDDCCPSLGFCVVSLQT